MRRPWCLSSSCPGGHETSWRQPINPEGVKDSPVNGTSAIIARLLSGFGESGPDRAHEREHEHGPAGTARARLDFSLKALGTGFSNLSPLRNQTLFIDDGLTASGSGWRQQFFVPDTITRLFLPPSCPTARMSRRGSAW